MHENQISYRIIGSALKIHKKVGPGLLESAYENALGYELTKSGLIVESQVPVPFIYDNQNLGFGFRIDLLVENKVIIEIKSVESLAPVHFSQVLTYLRLTDIKLGLLINFNTPLLKKSIHRIVNNL